jgi:antitoxin VapB
VYTRTAKIFTNGGSQAVRLPAEFRFDGVAEVYVRRDSVTGDIVLSTEKASSSWADFFALRDVGSPAADFLLDRPLNEPLRPTDALADI